KTYSGGCHCGAVRFEADLDIAAGTGKCNCTICTKMRLWLVEVRPDAFRLRAGETEMTDYRGRSDVAHHLFCRQCGLRPFEGAEMVGGGEAGDALARLQVVAAILQPEDLDRVGQGVAGDLVPRPELVAGALADQGRRRQPGEMRRAQLRRLSRRVEGVAQAQ